MEMRRGHTLPLDEGKFVFNVECVFDPEEAKQIMSRKDLFAGEGIPLDPCVELGGVPVFFDAPLQIAGMVIADADTVARFTCSSEQYDSVVRAVDGYLRKKLACIWPK